MVISIVIQIYYKCKLFPVSLFYFQMLQENQKTVLVLEDDAKFTPLFNIGLYNVLMEANRFTPSWDFM